MHLFKFNEKIFQDAYIICVQLITVQFNTTRIYKLFIEKYIGKYNKLHYIKTLVGVNIIVHAKNTSRDKYHRFFG